MSDCAIPSSFRDPSGSLFVREGVLYRRVNPVYRDHYDKLMNSGLYDDLVGKGLLVPHEEVTVGGEEDTTEAYKVLRPERVPFISYPYEWCFHQLQDAALATLRLQRRALKFGMSLKDASAYNIQFVGGRPVLIDTLSFEALDEGRPWVAYRQFCQHFLAPLALMSYNDVRTNQLLRAFIDGVPLDLAAGLLPRRTRLKPNLLLHIHWHARAQKKYEDSGELKDSGGRAMSKSSLLGVIESLQTAVKSLCWEPPKTVWATYYQDNSYSDAGLEHKRDIVGRFLERAAPAMVWDLGANTGLFSALALEKGAQVVVASDVDPACVDIMYRERVKKNGEHLLPLIVDLTNPSPALGWAHCERDSLVERGPADVALALALVHHLAIANNVPLPMVAEFLSRICQTLIIEFVPKSDPQVRRLLRTREDVFDRYAQADFEADFARHFVLEAQEGVRDSDRVVYLMRKR
jgi:predicted nicotinamide N-methyase